MTPLVKVCGLTTLDDALYCARAGAGALGFIFYKDSLRYISPDAAADIISKLPEYVTPVGVFVNESRTNIENIIGQTHIRLIQLCGDESPADCLGYNVKVWKAFRIRDQEEVARTKEYTISAAMLDGAGQGQYGGSGHLPDFSIACEMKEYHPVVLAGGLSPDTVLQAIGAVYPYAIDINSGVETEPGKKDHAKVKLLFERVSNFSRSQE